jgi:hypothetical protein
MRFAPLAVLLFLAQTNLANASLFGSSWSEDRDRASACFDSVASGPDVLPLSGKLARRDPTLVQLADENLPSDEDVRALTLRSQKERRCQEMMLSAVREHHSWFESAYQIRFFQVDLVYVQLLKKRITFGNANRLLQESYLEFSAREDQYFQARSDEQRRVLAESMRDLSRQAQSSPPPSGTGRMTCRWIGPTLYCDPY